MEYKFAKKDIFRGNLILVNKDNLIKEDFTKDLESYDLEYPKMLLNKKANIQLQKAMAELNHPNKIVPVSAYRSLEEQQKIFNDSLEENREEFTLKYVALPNASEHQTGLAIDLGLNLIDIDFICPKFPHDNIICNEFRAISLKYGFIERYQEKKEAITNISSEEWHFRYVGYPHAIIMQEHDFCLEEYIEYLKNFSYPKFLEYQNYKIAYISYDEDNNIIDLPNNLEISGNNIDGFIVTWME